MAVFKPQRFGKYFLFDRLAVGGMAEVFKAKLAGSESAKVYALKRIHPHHMENKDFVSMLIDEAKISVQLDHSSVIQVVDIGRVGDQCFICMEYIEGKDMRQLFDRCRDSGQTLPVADAVHVVAQVCRGLAYAHSLKDQSGNPLNIIHRDVSPQNVLISFDGDVKLIDFGIAKAAGRLMETQVGILKGKYAYMSPEQATGQTIDRRTDIFAAGVLLYEATVNQHPFRAPHDLETLRNIKDGKYIPPSEANPDLPPTVARIIETALSNRPEDRYSTADEMANALDRALSELVTRYKSSRLADFVQGLFSDEVMVRGRSAEEGSRIERDFLTGEVPAVQEKETFIGPDSNGAGNNGAGNGKGDGATVIGSPKPAGRAAPDTRGGTAVGPPPGARPEAVPRGAPTGGPSIRMGVQPQARAVGQVAPVQQPVPVQTGVGSRRMPGGPSFTDRILTGALTTGDTVGLALFSVVALVASAIMIVNTPTRAVEEDPGPGPTVAMNPTDVPTSETSPEESPTVEGTKVAEATTPPATPAPTGPAMLKLRSMPSRASVEINGNFVGETPLNVRNLTAAVEYRVVIRAPGYASWEGSVTPKPGEELLVKQALEQIPSGTINLYTEPPGATIFVDSHEESKKTPTILILPAGRHTIKVVHPSDPRRTRTFQKKILADREYNEKIEF